MGLVGGYWKADVTEVERLLAAGADVNAIFEFYGTPLPLLHVAVEKGATSREAVVARKTLM